MPSLEAQLVCTDAHYPADINFQSYVRNPKNVQKRNYENRSAKTTHNPSYTVYNYHSPPGKVSFEEARLIRLCMYCKYYWKTAPC